VQIAGVIIEIAVIYEHRGVKVDYSKCLRLTEI